MPAPRLLAALSATALIMTLAACSTGSETESSDERLTPLGDFFAAVYGDTDDDEWMKRAEEDNREREIIVAGCMAEQGFEYEPVVDMGFSSSEIEWEPDDREWVAQWGYGMVRSPGSDQAPSPEEIVEDPNQDYVMSLSESEMTAYYEALYGPQPTEEELNEDGSYEYNWETAGCQGLAQHEIDKENPLSSDEHKPIMDAVNAFYTGLEEAKVYSAIDADWAACMADAGHPGFTSQFDAQESISQDLNAYWESVTEPVEDDPALDELADSEIALALADLECREDVDFADRRHEISVALEEEFIADNKAALDALAAAAEQGREQ